MVLFQPEAKTKALVNFSMMKQIPITHEGYILTQYSYYKEVLVMG